MNDDELDDRPALPQPDLALPDSALPDELFPEAAFLEAMAPPSADTEPGDMEPVSGGSAGMEPFIAEATAGDTLPPEPATASWGDLEALVATLDAEVRDHPEPVAAAPASAAATPGLFVSFRLGGSRYAVPFGNVVEVGSLPAVTPVPHLAAWVRGVANLRGEILSIVDLASWLGAGGRLEAERRPGSERLLVVRTAGEAITTGLVVDQVTGMLNVALADLVQPTAPLDDPGAPYRVGVALAGDSLVNILDLDRLLASPRFRRPEAS